MKFIKKYGLYLVLLAVTAMLGSVGYITESRKEMEEKTEEITYIPEEKVAEPAPLEDVSAPVIVAKEGVVAPPATDENTEVLFVQPVVGEPSVSYSGDKMIFSETMDDFRVHSGLDFACNSGEGVAAAAKGQVTDIYEDDFLGLCLQMEHPDGTITKYCALSEAKVTVGDSVEGGDIIALAGNSARGESAGGVHLHFEAMRNGENIDPATLFDK